MKTAILLLCTCTISTLFFFSCSKKQDTVSICDGVPKDFVNNVNPLIQTYCNQIACHNSNSTNGPGPLTNYAEVFNARVAIRGQIQAGLMPQNTTLTAEQKNTILCW